jgi:16S rRNA G966 N2-methylase RsmD
VVRDDQFAQLYDSPLPSTRSGPLFAAHSYPTKISHESAAACILVHTKPGDVILDGFSGSGSTGLAAALCGNPPDELRNRLESRYGPLVWGDRNAVLYDISPLATFISRTLLNPPDLDTFVRSAHEVLFALQRDWSWLYEASNPTGGTGTIRHSIWSEELLCPGCGHKTPFWEVFVNVDRPSIDDHGHCPVCGLRFASKEASRATEGYLDDLLGGRRERRSRVPVLIYGSTEGRPWRREPLLSDIELIESIAETPVPENFPILPMLNRTSPIWGYMHRAGYHFGITHLHHLYTRRNLIAITAAWNEVNNQPNEVRDALRLWISSYNASHSTLMARIVCKKGAKDFVLTSAQPGALYVSSLPVEKNVFIGLSRKLRTMVGAFKVTQGLSSTVEVRCESCLQLHLADNSVDYIFTDPPFGENIQYSEVNFISEAWLGSLTTEEDEVVVSPYQGKGVDEYQLLLKRAFGEFFRVLKPGRYMTLVFHSSAPEVWNAVRAAWDSVGFELVRTSVLDKRQGSFKQTTTAGAVQKDPLFLLRKPPRAESPTQLKISLTEDPGVIVDERLRSLPLDEKELRTSRHLYSFFIGRSLELGLDLTLSAEKFYQVLSHRYHERAGGFYLKS